MWLTAALKPPLPPPPNGCDSCIRRGLRGPSIIGLQIRLHVGCASNRAGLASARSCMSIRPAVWGSAISFWLLYIYIYFFHYYYLCFYYFYFYFYCLFIIFIFYLFYFIYFFSFFAFIFIIITIIPNVFLNFITCKGGFGSVGAEISFGGCCCCRLLVQLRRTYDSISTFTGINSARVGRSILRTLRTR